MCERERERECERDRERLVEILDRKGVTQKKSSKEFGDETD